jgi:hypothetical protein
MESNNYITDDFENDRLLRINFGKEYSTTLMDRANREKEAFAKFSNNMFPHQPLVTLEWLQKRAKTPWQAEWHYKQNQDIGEIRQKAEEDIANGNYAAEGNEHWEYKKNYEAAVDQFNNNWPDLVEYNIRKQEKDSLLKLLSQLQT